MGIIKNVTFFAYIISLGFFPGIACMEQHLADTLPLSTAQLKDFDMLRTTLAFVEQAHNKAEIVQQEELFKLLLESAPDAVHGVDADGKTLLHYAVQLRLANIVRLLLQYSKAEIYKIDKSGQTPSDIMYNSMAHDNGGELYYEYSAELDKIELKGTDNFVKIRKLLLKAKEDLTRPSIAILVAHGAQVPPSRCIKTQQQTKHDLKYNGGSPLADGFSLIGASI